MRIDGKVVLPGKRRDVAYVPQETGAFPYFQRPRETLALGLAVRGVQASDYPQQFLDALSALSFFALLLPIRATQSLARQAAGNGLDSLFTGIAFVVKNTLRK